jgi:hypothetical protein
MGGGEGHVHTLFLVNSVCAVLLSMFAFFLGAEDGVILGLLKRSGYQNTGGFT